MNYWLQPLSARFSLARAIEWQARYLTEYGARRLALFFMKEFADQVTFHRAGLRWTISLEDNSVPSELWFTPQVEERTLARLIEWATARGHLARAQTILEIGANIGSTTLRFTQMTSCHIIAVEPVPRTLALLKQNLAQNHMRERVTLIERAVSETDGQAEMLVPLSAYGGAEIFVPNVTRPEAIFKNACETIVIQTTRVDTLLRELKVNPAAIAFVWCDVQGSEGAVIATGELLWRAGVPLWAEIAPRLLERQRGLEPFFADVTRYFDAYLTRTELVAQGLAATPRPISTFAEFVAQLHGETFMDVLFIPRAHL